MDSQAVDPALLVMDNAPASDSEAAIHAGQAGVPQSHADPVIEEVLQRVRQEREAEARRTGFTLQSQQQLLMQHAVYGKIMNVL